MKLWMLLLVVASFSAPVFALELSHSELLQDRAADPGDPVDHLEVGSYRSANGYFQNLTITSWATEYLLKANVRYGTYLAELSINLNVHGGNSFAGTGMLVARYANGAACTYDVTVRIKAFTSGLYIRGHLPDNLASEIIGGVCPVQNIGEYTHEAPYVKL